MRSFTLIVSLVVTLCCVVFSGCAGDTDDGLTDSGKPEDGKEDAVGRLCRDAGLPADCDICTEREWYGDGECDDFCSNPDPDCEAPVDPQCSWDNPSRVGDSTMELNDHVTGRVTVTIDDIDILDVIQSRQIWTACEHLEFLQGNEDFDIVFEATDEGEFYLKEAEVAGIEYDWVSFYAGDSEVGVVFLANTLEIVGEVSDGGIMGCGEQEEPTGEVVCHWDTETPLVDDSSALRELATSSREVTTDDLDSLSDLDCQQLFTAALHLELITGDEDCDMVFEVADEGVFELIDVTVDNTSFDWVSLYAGDTEVGVVFAAGTTDIVGEIGDGDIMGCVRQ